MSLTSYTQRDKAWAIRSYPCTGLGLFLKPMIPKSRVYKSIIRRLQEGERLLDVGCFLGQDLRRLVTDGASSENLYAMNIVSHWDLGYKIFRDREIFSAHFIETDILHLNSALQALKGTFNTISISHVLHQWEWNDQVSALKQQAILSRVGAIIVGFQVGSVGFRKRPASELAKSSAYWHNPESFQEIWDQVGEETGTEWLTEAQLKTWDEFGWNPNDTAYLRDDARIIQGYSIE